MVGDISLTTATGAKAHGQLRRYAALKRRSSTAMRANDADLGISFDWLRRTSSFREWWMRRKRRQQFGLRLALTGVLMSSCGIAVAQAAPIAPAAQTHSQDWTWEKVKERFEMNNPTLLADTLNIDESRAQEITAFLRPNPTFNLSVDGTQIAPNNGIWRPFAGTSESPGLDYLHERQRKRELRLEGAETGTLIAESNHADLERTLLFNLRGAFVSTLQAKAVLQVAKDNLEYYDHVLKISRDRFAAGDIAQMDLDRLELQRVQYESDVQTAEVDLRTSKIPQPTLMNDRTPIEQFDTSGTFDFNDRLGTRDEYRRIALDTR